MNTRLNEDEEESDKKAATTALTMTPSGLIQDQYVFSIWLFIG
jgi:hypothetical protein